MSTLSRIDGGGSGRASVPACSYGTASGCGVCGATGSGTSGTSVAAISGVGVGSSPAMSCSTDRSPASSSGVVSGVFSAARLRSRSALPMIMPDARRFTSPGIGTARSTRSV